jgi:neutral ceramidase
MKSKFFLLLSAVLSCVGPAIAAHPNNLRVGAAKVDITPPDTMATSLKNVWGTVYTGIHDHIYVRAIVIDDGKTSAALVSIDTSSMPDNIDVRRRIQKETGVPASNIMISTTHTHNAPAVGAGSSGRQGSPQAPAYTANVENALVEAVRQSKARLQPGKMLLATGHADLNVNRDEFVGDRWKTGRNPTRPSDKTVWILRFDNAAGEPLAFFVNYGVHALTLGPDNTLLTGDFPGSTSRFIESYYQDKVVSLWTSGPAGDQNLIASSWDLDDVLTHKVREPGEAGFQLSDSLGRILGEEVIRATSSSKDVKQVATSVSLWSSSKDVTCPGQQFDREAYARGEIKFNNIQPQTVHMDLLMINDIALAGVAAEVVTNIYYHLKSASPLANTILVSLNNGRLTYMPDDAAYDAPIFEVRSSSLKRGCGEGAIVNSFVEMIDKRRSIPDPTSAGN